jgi:hypothetical protein
MVSESTSLRGSLCDSRMNATEIEMRDEQGNRVFKIRQLLTVYLVGQLKTLLCQFGLCDYRPSLERL